jgi:hypothetical protein
MRLAGHLTVHNLCHGLDQHNRAAHFLGGKLALEALDLGYCRRILGESLGMGLAQQGVQVEPSILPAQRVVIQMVHGEQPNHRLRRYPCVPQLVSLGLGEEACKGGG